MEEIEYIQGPNLVNSPLVFWLCIKQIFVHKTFLSISITFYQKLRPQHVIKIAIKTHKRGTWVAQSVKRPTLAQVMISWLVSLSPTSGSVLSAQSLEPASDSVSPSLSTPPQLVLCLFLSLKNE